MAESTGSMQIVINHRTLRVGRQAYSLNTIARVQVRPVPRPADAGKGNSGLGCAVAIGVLVLMGIIAAAAQSTALGTIGFLLAIAAGIIAYVKSKKSYTPLYMLMLETNGSPMAALVSPDQENLEWVAERVVEAIESPPETEKSFTVQNVSIGDNYTMTGNHNIGRMG